MFLWCFRGTRSQSWQQNSHPALFSPQPAEPVNPPGKGESGFLWFLTTSSFWLPSTGCILGVGLVLSLLSHSGQTESRVHVAASLRRLSAHLDDGSGSRSRTFQEVGAGAQAPSPSGFGSLVAADFLLGTFWWPWT